MLRIGLIGCGFMGRMHANVYKALDGATLVAAVDVKADVAKTYAADFDIKPYTSL